MIAQQLSPVLSRTLESDQFPLLNDPNKACIYVIKVTTIKEAKDLARIKLDEFLGSLKVHKQEIMNGIYLENALKASTSSQKTIRPQPLKKKMYYFWRGGRTSFHLKENLENEIHKEE